MFANGWFTYAMAFMVPLLVGWVIWNNKPLYDAAQAYAKKFVLRRSSWKGNAASRNNFTWSTWTLSCLQNFGGKWPGLPVPVCSPEPSSFSFTHTKWGFLLQWWSRLAQIICLDCLVALCSRLKIKRPQLVQR